MRYVIETVYKGYRFRSRLEARWAVFFETMMVKWEYEEEGFMVGGKPYLPDFYLREYDWYIEVKPDDDNLIKKGIDKARHFCDNKTQPLIFFIGVPGDERFIVLRNIDEITISQKDLQMFYCEDCMKISFLDGLHALRESRKYESKFHLLGCECINRENTGYDYISKSLATARLKRFDRENKFRY